MLLRCRGVESVALLQPLALNIDIARHQNHRAKPFLQIAFEQQRYFVNYDGVAGFTMLANSSFGQGAHARMDDRFELFARVGVVEDEGAEFLPIKVLVGLQNFVAEGRDDLFPAVMTWRYHFA